MDKYDYSKTVSNKRVAEILRAARNAMNHGGKHWIKGDYNRKKEDVGMCYCSVGAIHNTTKNQAERSAAFRALLVAGLEEPMPVGSYWAGSASELARYEIIRWNDMPKRTWNDVTKAFTKASRKAAR